MCRSDPSSTSSASLGAHGLVVEHPSSGSEHRSEVWRSGRPLGVQSPRSAPLVSTSGEGCSQTDGQRRGCCQDVPPDARAPALQNACRQRASPRHLRQGRSQCILEHLAQDSDVHPAYGGQHWVGQALQSTKSGHRVTCQQADGLPAKQPAQSDGVHCTLHTPQLASAADRKPGNRYSASLPLLNRVHYHLSDLSGVFPPYSD